MGGQLAGGGGGSSAPISGQDRRCGQPPRRGRTGEDQGNLTV